MTSDGDYDLKDWRDEIDRVIASTRKGLQSCP
ncbi:unnamed protein product [Anisakis simplex]|uniref:Uncharacterized protein n=1 Tax=Anisakis simplex TaxID=6269 RepID=A0A3P6P253_ANISI|nr:unnamed protein product [Anisakis simplex]